MSQKTKLTVGDTAPDFTVTDASGQPFTLSSRGEGRSAALIFLRYLGCPLCQMAMGELRRRSDDFRQRNAELLVFLEADADSLRSYGDTRGFDFRLIPDPRKEIYRLYGVGRGPLAAVLHPEVVMGAVRATVKGYFHGKFNGDEYQLPGDFIVGPDGRILHAHVGRHYADNTPIDTLLAALDGAK